MLACSTFFNLLFYKEATNVLEINYELRKQLCVRSGTKLFIGLGLRREFKAGTLEVKA